jgi:hypothetical protein
VTNLIDALESLKMRADLAIRALRRGDRAAAVREIDVATRELRDAVREDDAPMTKPAPVGLAADAGTGSDKNGG